MKSIELVRSSNFLAEIYYSRKILDLDYKSIDLSLGNINNSEVPFLVHGSNLYSSIAVEKRILLPNLLREKQNKKELFLVIPEVSYLLDDYKSEYSGCTSAIRSLMHNQEITFSHAWFEDLCIADLIRYYDSHLSIFAYEVIVKNCMEKLGYNVKKLEVEYEVRDYLPDLASRFSTSTIKSPFPSEKFLVKEEKCGDSNRGIFRKFENDDFRIDKSLTIIGDSHSYSCLSQIFSFIFREVYFIWSSSYDNFSSNKVLVKNSIESSDFVIEEVAERFFLNNFTVKA